MKSKPMKSKKLTLLAALLGVALTTQIHAQLIVTTNSDSGPGSLRQAIADASSGDTITFAISGVITLTSGELLITNDLTITGPGPTNLILNPNHASRGFEIRSQGTASISGLAIMNGFVVSGSGSSGGGIYNAGTLTLSNAIVSLNTAGTGGGIYNAAGTVTIDNSTLSANTANELS